MAPKLILSIFLCLTAMSAAEPLPAQESGAPAPLISPAEPADDKIEDGNTSATQPTRPVQPAQATPATPVPTDRAPFGGNPLELSYNATTERAACEPYDLRDTLIGSDRPLPARRYQGDSGWCYAMVLSDLLSLHLRAAVSPADIALNNLNHSMGAHMRDFDSAESALAQVFPLGGGVPPEALRHLNQRGVCLEADLPVDLSVSAPRRPPAAGALKDTSPGPAVDADGLMKFFEPANRASARRLLGAIQSSDFVFALNHLAEHPRCEPRFNDLNVRLDIDSYFAPDAERADPPPTYAQREAFWSRLNAALGPGRIVAISYLPEVLTETPREYLREQAPLGFHLSSIVGRRYNAEKTRCEYLVRNTENDCDRYVSDYDCENNHVWVPRQALRLGISHYMTLREN